MKGLGYYRGLDQWRHVYGWDVRFGGRVLGQLYQVQFPLYQVQFHLYRARQP